MSEFGLIVVRWCRWHHTARAPLRWSSRDLSDRLCSSSVARSAARTHAFADGHTNGRCGEMQKVDGGWKGGGRWHPGKLWFCCRLVQQSNRQTEESTCYVRSSFVNIREISILFQLSKWNIYKFMRLRERPCECVFGSRTNSGRRIKWKRFGSQIDSMQIMWILVRQGFLLSFLSCVFI